jgi:hypothetical protein
VVTASNVIPKQISGYTNIAFIFSSYSPGEIRVRRHPYG